MADMDVTAKFRADTSDFQKGAKRVKDDLSGVQQSAKQSSDGFTTLKGSLSAAFGIGAVVGIQKVTSAVRAFMSEAVDLARESELTVRRLDQIAASMGVLDTVLGGSTQRLQDYAQELQNQTAVSDETIKSAQALILTFKDVASSAGEAGGVFDRVTAAALDLAAAGFGNVEGNARSLARALQDPLKGLTMLGRQGVTFTKQEQDKIKALVASNRLHEAQTLILGAVEKQVGGTAAATATGTAKMSAAFKDVQESIGLLMLPALDAAADSIRENLLPQMQQAVDVYGPALSAMFEDAAIQAIDFLIALGHIIEHLGLLEAAISGAEKEQRSLVETLGDAYTWLRLILGTVTSITTSYDILATLGRETRQSQEDLNKTNDLAAQRYTAMAQALTQTGTAVGVVNSHQTALNAVTAAGITAVTALQAGFEGMNRVIGNQNSRNAAIRSTRDLSKELDKNGTKIKGTSEAAMANQDAIARSAQAWLNYAQATDDPIKQQERLEKGEKAIRAALEEKGIDPEQSPILRNFKRVADESKTAVDDFAARAREARKYGIDTGRNFINGILQELRRGRAAVGAESEGVGGEMPAGVDRGTKSDSPSKEGMKNARNFVDGVILGLGAGRGSVNNHATALGKGLAKAFAEALGDGMQSALSTVFGSLPPVPSALEQMLGEKGAEAWLKNNKKALIALQRVAAEVDRIRGVLEDASVAFIEMAELVAKPFGEASEIMRMFGKDANISSIISGLKQVGTLIQEAYKPLLDPKIVGRAAARRNRAEMNAQLGTLQSLGGQMVELRRQYDRNLKEMERLEKEYGEKVNRINAHFDRLEEAAQANIARIEAHWASVIPGLEQALRAANEAYSRENTVLERLISDRDSFLRTIATGFRGFVNSLQFGVSGSSKQVIREAKKLANGITVTIEREIEVGGSPQNIAKALETRLAAVRDFSRNIRTLMARGLDPTLVQDFVSAGVSGAGDAAAALVQASDQELQSINQSQAALAAEIASFQQYATQQWHDAGIAQQQAVVAPLKAAADAAQAALNAANAARTAELAAARAHLEQLRNDRKAALEQAKLDHDEEMNLLRADNLRLEGEMDQLAQRIDDMLTNLAMTLPPKAFAAGQKSMRQLRAGFEERFPAVSKKLNGMMDALAASMNRTATITIRTVYESVGSPTPRAKGGAVNPRDVYLVGEKGPEIFVPGSSGTIIPNNRIADVPNMAGMRSSGGQATIINVNVQTGIATDPAETGRQVVEAIRKYERRSGPVFVSV